MASFKFTLITPDTSVIFGAEKVRNWQDIASSLVMNDTYRAVAREYTNTFEFTDDIRGLIIQAIDFHGYDCEILMTLEIGNDNKERRSFKIEGQSMRADVPGIEVTELAASVNFIDTGFVADFMNRHDMKVNLNVTESIDGAFLTPHPVLRDVHLHDRTLIFNSRLENESELQIINAPAPAYSGYRDYGIPAKIKFASDKAFKNVVGGVSPALVAGEDWIHSFYLTADRDRSIDLLIDFDFDYRCTDGTGDWLMYLRHIDADKLQKSFIILESSVFHGGDHPNISTTKNTVHINYHEDVEMLEGESLALTFTHRKTDTLISNDFEFTTINLVITGVSLEIFPATTCQSLLLHEIFSRLIEIYTGKASSFYSEFFGRQEIGYAQDGKGAWLAVANGYMIRQFPYDDIPGTEETEAITGHPLNTSFKEAFENVMRIFNLCAFVETIEGIQRIRIEPYEYIRKKKISVKLGRMNGVSRMIDAKRLYNKIEVGYKDQEYEELNGLFQFHGQFTFTTPFRGEATELNLLCDWRADDIGIELTRRLPYEDDPDKDYRADKHIFFLDCNKPFSDVLFLRREVTGTVQGVYNSELAYNIQLSPKRMLLNWGGEIKAGLLRNEGKLMFVKGAANSEVVTDLAGEGVISEKADINISDLPRPNEYPEIILIAEAELTPEQNQLIRANPFDLIEFEHKGVTLYGYVQLKEFAHDKKTCNFELSRALY